MIQRIVATKGQPVFFCRWHFGAHGAKIRTRNILGLCEIKPITLSLIGLIEGAASKCDAWLARMQGFGRAGG